MVKRILVPVSLEVPGAQLIQYAGQLAQTLQAELLLVCCTKTTDITFTLQSRLIQALRSLAERTLQQADHPVIECIVRPGQLSDCVKSLVQDYAVDLTLLNSEYEEASIIATITSCPVMLVPAQPYYKPLQQIVFATDFTDRDDKTLKRIAAFAVQAKSHLTMVQVYTYGQRDQRNQIKQGMIATRQLLQGQDITYKMLEEDDVLEGISEYAALQQADMLLFATQDSHLLERLYSQSNLKTMAYHTQVPVLAYRQMKKKPCSGCCANCKSKQTINLQPDIDLALINQY